MKDICYLWYSFTSGGINLFCFQTGNLNRLKENSVGTLDLGGGSTQIVFQPIAEVSGYVHIMIEFFIMDLASQLYLHVFPYRIHC